MNYITESKVVISAQIKREQREALQRQAVAEDRTLSAVVRRVIADYLGGDGNSEGAPQVHHLRAAPSDNSEGGRDD